MQYDALQYGLLGAEAAPTSAVGLCLPGVVHNLHTLYVCFLCQCLTHHALTCLPPVLQENARVNEHMGALMEELAAMHAAWAERDVKQRMTDVEIKELGHQVGWAVG